MTGTNYIARTTSNGLPIVERVNTGKSTMKQQVTSRLSHRHIHTSPIDERHQVDIWEDNTGKRYFAPQYRNRTRGTMHNTWVNYRDHNEMVHYPTYARAVNHIKRSKGTTQPGQSWFVAR